MAFVKGTWTDKVTRVSAAQLNRIEQGVADAYGTVLVVNQSADLDVPGLDGEADGGYEITVVGRMSSAAQLLCRPNADAGNNYAGLYNQTLRAVSSAVTNGVGATGAAGLLLGSNPGSTAYYLASKAVFHSSSQAGQYGRPFSCNFTAKSELTSGEAMAEQLAMWWNPASAATALNKLTFSFGGATFNGHILVRKLA